MSKETKDIIQKNIEARVNSDFADFKKELNALCLKYLPHRYEFDLGQDYLTQVPRDITGKFLDEIRPVAIEYLTRKRESEFSSILSNLGEYLEMIKR